MRSRLGLVCALAVALLVPAVAQAEPPYVSCHGRTVGWCYSELVRAGYTHFHGEARVEGLVEQSNGTVGVGYLVGDVVEIRTGGQEGYAELVYVVPNDYEPVAPFNAVPAQYGGYFAGKPGEWEYGTAEPCVESYWCEPSQISAGFTRDMETWNTADFFSVPSGEQERATTFWEGFRLLAALGMVPLGAIVVISALRQLVA